MPRRAMRVVVPGAGGLPIIPDLVGSVRLQVHPRLHGYEPLCCAVAINGFSGHIEHREQPSCYEVGLVVRVREPDLRRAPAGISSRPLGGLPLDSEGQKNGDHAACVGRAPRRPYFCFNTGFFLISPAMRTTGVRPSPRRACCRRRSRPDCRRLSPPRRSWANRRSHPALVRLWRAMHRRRR